MDRCSIHVMCSSVCIQLHGEADLVMIFAWYVYIIHLADASFTNKQVFMNGFKDEMTGARVRILVNSNIHLWQCGQPTMVS